MEFDGIATPGALNGVRVVDFGWVLAGPYSTMLLAYLGAEVIKVESKRRIDEQRIAHRAGLSEDFEASSNFFEVNLGKRSVTINLSKPDGVALAKRLVAISDVVLENMRPGVMDRLGLGYADLSQVKPDIIMVSISGWGSSGPLREYTAYAPCFSSFGGLAHLAGYSDGEPNPGTSSNDARSGTAAAFAALMALVIRQRTGEGQYIDLSASEALNALVGENLVDAELNGRSPRRGANRDVVLVPHNCYRCAGDDRWISIAVGTDDEWQALCEAMGNPEWASDEGFSTPERRRQEQGRLDALIEAWTMNQEPFALMEYLQARGVAAAPSFTGEDLYSNRHLQQRGSIVEMTHPRIGSRKTIAPPWTMSELPHGNLRTAPMMGEGNSYVLGELLGMEESEIVSLEEAGVVF